MIRAFVDRLLAHRPTTAEAWVARSQSRPLSPRESLWLDEWLASNKANRAEFERCQRLSALGDRMRSRSDLVRAMPAYKSLPREDGKAQRAWKPFMLLAAGSACAVLLVLVVPRFSTEAPRGVITTARGEQRQVALEDGSRVHLNSDSSLQVAFTDGERRVILAAGEAFFEVSKDSSGRPFVVTARDTQIRVVGTRFSVRTTESRTDVVVAEGKVEVIPDVARTVPSIPAKVELVPGNSLRFDRLESHVRIAAVDPARATAWRSGMIDFDSATLPEVIEEVNRYVAVPFVIADDRLRDVKLSGTFKVGDVDSVTFALRDGFDIEAVQGRGQITLRRR